MNYLNRIYKIVSILLICMVVFTCTKTISIADSTDIENKNEYVGIEDIVIYNKAISGEYLLTGGVANTLCDILPEEISTSTIEKDVIVEETLNVVVDEETIVNNTVEEPIEDSKNENGVIINNISYSHDDIYKLAKIIMCEAEGEPQKCKEYVGQTVLNRVRSDKFPDTIHDVIFQRSRKSVQFSPTVDGRWESVEPNQDCYDAAYTVLEASEPLTDALYFEACDGDSWHARNLTQIDKVGKTRFYI